MVRNPLSIRKKIIFISSIAIILIYLIIIQMNKINEKSFSLDINEITSNLYKINNSNSYIISSSTEEKAIDQFKEFYSDYSIHNIEDKISKLYDENVYFIDPLHDVRGIHEVKKYFLKMAEPVQSCRFEITNIYKSTSKSDISHNYFARWNMYLISKAAPNKKVVTSGFTHFKLNRDGKIVFHQDFWDTSALLDELPIVGFWSKFVKNKMLGNLDEN